MEHIDYKDLSDFIIAYCNVNNIHITNKKLQKLMYYCQAWNLALLEEELIEDDFQAWVHGAVLRPLYYNYSNCGYNRIYIDNDKATNIINKFKKNTPDVVLNLIERVFKKYINYDADKLEEINHSEYPWIKAREGLQPNESSEAIITKESIQEYYAMKALEEGMKEVKNNIFKFSSIGLKKAQEKIINKEVFKPNESNYSEYEKFILNSYDCSSELIERAEYGKTI